LERVLDALARDLKYRRQLDPSECFIDGIFMAPSWPPAKGRKCGSDQVGHRDEAPVSADRADLPRAARAASAAPHEVTLVAVTLDSRFVDPLSERLFADHAYDADPLDDALHTGAVLRNTIMNLLDREASGSETSARALTLLV
jgi:hypothetical protein